MALSSPLLSSPCSGALIAARRLLLLLVVMVVPLADIGLAQTQRLLHVWVDPHYGDDTVAAAWNPNASPGSYQCSSSDTHPHNVFAGTVPPVLVHAAAPFKTVTAAITYIRSIHPSGLPQHNSVTGIDTVGVVIHCLPGIYGPGSGTEAYSGLPFNGETLPIRLPEYVSIQGASGLNTVFMSDGSKGVFEFGTSQNAFSSEAPGVKPHQFLANIAITGAIREVNGSSSYAGHPWEGSGIYVAKDREARLLIEQCFIYANATGLLVDYPTGTWNPTGDPTTPGFQGHVVTVINNTFAWNVVGIWSGQYNSNASPSQANSSIGGARVSLLNNLFDASAPADRTFTPPILDMPLPIQGASPNRVLLGSWYRWSQALLNTNGLSLLFGGCMTDFEGIDRDDLEAFGPNGYMDYNGAELNRRNSCSSALGTLTWQSINQLTFLGLHQTTERNAAPSAPYIEISGYTGGGTYRRGILFVRDLLHEGARFSTNPYFIAAGSPDHGEDFDVCVADFRLSPAAGHCGSAALGNPPTVVNPVAEQGYDFANDANGNPVPVQMRNGLLVSADPFDLGDAEEEFPFNPGNWDVEGFGNPRIYDHLWQFPSAYGRGNTDLGGDELDLNIMIGYRTFTTTFIATNGQAGSPSNDFQWYLAASDNIAWTTGNNVGTTTPTLGPWHSDYLPVSGWSSGPSTPYYTPRYVDVVPHLMPDWHPWWTPQPHVYPTNIFWQPCQPYLSYINNSLWMTPASGIINPVGTYTVIGNSLGFRWLDNDLLAYFDPSLQHVVLPWMLEATFDPNPPPPAPNSSNITNAFALTLGWCFLGDGNTSITYVHPSQNPRFQSGDNAMRISCEYFPALQPWYDSLFNGGTGDQGSNLQSFMILKP